MPVNSESRCRELHPQLSHRFGRADHGEEPILCVSDGWLVAHGRATGKTVVTNEQPRPESHNQIKLPDVCNVFSVDFEDTFAMLHGLGVQYRFSANL